MNEQEFKHLVMLVNMLLQSVDFELVAPNDGTTEHLHSCGSCGYSWWHPHFSSIEDHACPRCQDGPWTEQLERR